MIATHAIRHKVPDGTAEKVYPVVEVAAPGPGLRLFAMVDKLILADTPTWTVTPDGVVRCDGEPLPGILTLEEVT